MADAKDSGLLPSIAALPSTTVRQIGSTQVLVDPSSAVKELIENALDARAKGIFVDISINTVDSIQVKDDGHGIPAEDRALVCRRYCTSKIRDFHDLEEVGGKWLGFRGEAMAGLAEMSGTLAVTSRVEGESVAVTVKYGKSGEIVSTERASHPVGTTVKVTNFFEAVPVRKQAALQSSLKCLAKIRRLMQAYTLARPSVRFRLHVLNAKTNKTDFVYAPKAKSNVKDAVFKVTGKDCASQCDSAALSADGFEIHAFLPKPSANGRKIANQGAFISIDARPVSTSRGTLKQIVATFKNRLGRASPAFGALKDPFFCINILCPPNSYDPNVEPAKDDMLFKDGDMLVKAVDKLLMSYYPEVVSGTEEIRGDIELLRSTQLPHSTWEEDSASHSYSPFSIQEDLSPSEDKESVSSPSKQQQRWRSNMYGIDEEDLEFLSMDQPLNIEDEEGRRAAEVSNPWTIARMNATVKPKRPNDNSQLLTPARNATDIIMPSSSTVPARVPRQPILSEPLTPQTSSRLNIIASPLGDSLLSPLSPSDHGETGLAYPTRENSCFLRNHQQSVMVPSSTTHEVDQLPQWLANAQGTPPNRIPAAPIAPRRSQRNKSLHSNGLLESPTRGSKDAEFGQRTNDLASAKVQRRRQRRVPPQETSLALEKKAPVSRRAVLNASEQLVENRLYSKNNTDIRDFFRCERDMHSRSSSADSALRSTFKPINPQRQSKQLAGHLSLVEDSRGRGFAPSSQFSHSNGTHSGASSTEPHPRSRGIRDRLGIYQERNSTEPHDIAGELRAYTDREAPPSEHTYPTMPVEQRLPLKAIEDDGHMHGDYGVDPGLHSRGNRFRFHENLVPYPPGTIASFGVSRSSKKGSIAFQPPNTNTVNVLKPFEKREDRRRDRSSSPVCGTATPTSPLHECVRKHHLPRPRITDGLFRTKSSSLPLERTPHGYRIQNLVLSLTTNVQALLQGSSKLDMSRNTPQWGCPAEESYEGFALLILDKKIMEWVFKINGMLDRRFEKKQGVDVCSAMEAGIKSGLDNRKSVEGTMNQIQEDDMVRRSLNENSTEGAERVGVVDDNISNPGRHIRPSISRESTETECDKQVEGQMAVNVVMQPIEGVGKGDDEFKDFEDDEMLMSL